ncbi:MAG: ABC transporter substrate-binding protein [Ruminococcaceae bacterium]|nr:ABC transporter substrate-binding protein [Oscillospiraceae bacterium]
MRSLKRLCKLLALSLALLLLVSCTPAINGPAGDHGIAFTDSTGQEVVLQSAPTRVAVLFSSLAEIWILAGGEISVTVGETVERGIAEEGVILADDGAGKTVNTEVLLAAAPDLVILSADIPAQVEAAAALRAAGVPAALFRVETFTEYLSVLHICADLCGTDAYRTYGTAQQAQIEALCAEKPFAGRRILFIRAGTTARSVKAKGSADHFAAAMLRELGAENIADNAPILIDGLSMEVILQEDPDYIFFIAMGDEEASGAYVTEMLQKEEWQALGAVQRGSFCYLPKELFHYKPCDRWAEAYTYLATLEK